MARGTKASLFGSQVVQPNEEYSTAKRIRVHCSRKADANAGLEVESIELVY
jgi:hypothetical protein